MSIRRLVRLSQSQTTGLQTTNWTTQGTPAYNAATPGAGPVAWGTDPEIANLDRDFDATGSAKSHLGALLTITDAPDRFWGAVIKSQITYGPTDDPKLELWTHDATNGWVLRRRLDVPALARSGDPTVFDLTLATPLTGVDQAWITLNPTSTETNNWIVLHLYGDCDQILAIPDCPLFSEPPDCSLPWPTTDPWTPDNPPLEPIPGVPPGPVPTAFPTSPITISVAMPTTYVHVLAGWSHPCPGPTRIRFYFSIRGGSAATIGVLLAPGVIFNVATQNLVGSGFVDFVVTNGFFPNVVAPRGPFLPPRQILPAITFALTPSLNFSTLDFLDWESFLITADILYSEIC